MNSTTSGTSQPRGNLASGLLTAAVVLLPAAMTYWTGTWALGVSAVLLVVVLLGRGIRRRRKWWETVANGAVLSAGVVGVYSAAVAIATVGSVPPYDQRVAFGWAAMALAAAASIAGLSAGVGPVASSAAMVLASLLGTVLISFFYINTYYFAAVPLWLLAAAFTLASRDDGRSTSTGGIDR